ncbi:MAG: DUF6261 family protein [Tannerellaceae bacterium]|jgi:hypothetical protein|nr:DUF6261 family protein [Tannerellaceae bacterium]
MSSVKKFLRLVDKLRNAEHFGFYEYIVKAYTPYEPLFAELAGVWKAFHSLFTKENEIYKRNPRQWETASIRSAWLKTRSAFLLIKRTVEAASYDTDEAAKAASGKLAFVLGNYSRIPAVAMNEVSALVINLIQDLRQPATAAAAELLRLAPHIGRLEDANEAFRELYLTRAKEQEYLAIQGNMQEIRPQVDAAFARFAQTLDSAHTIARVTGQAAKAATLAEVIESLNAIILQYKHTCARRRPGHASARSNDDN